jgi:hypothetical protein
MIYLKNKTAFFMQCVVVTSLLWSSTKLVSIDILPHAPKKTTGHRYNITVIEMVKVLDKFFIIRRVMLRDMYT